MTAAARLYAFMGLCVLLALAGCGRGMLQQGERQAWRAQAEVQCMKSGAVKLGAGVVQIKPIEGPGMCGADFPLKVAALGEGGTRLGYNDIPRPPGGIAGSSQMPDWPGDPRYTRPVAQPMPSPPQAAQMRWAPGPPAIGAPEVTAPQGQPQQYQPLYQSPYNQTPPVYAPRALPQYQAPQTYEPRNGAPAGRPVSIYPPGVAPPPRDDIPDDAVLPQRYGQPPRAQPAAYNSPAYAPPPQPRYTPPALGPMRGPSSTGAIMPAALTPAATLSCPIVSALDRWVAEGVQPAAVKWFGAQVTEIRQISAYSCRSMVGAGTAHISEHAFGNALDIAGFTLADGRKITVKDGWRGAPEEQGFLHDVQLFACETFVTVLAPGYNAAHYDHIHVDLMRRKNGRRPCQPTAIPGEVVAAKARAVYASKHGGQYTGSIGKTSKTAKPGSALEAVPGADGLADDDDDHTGSIGAAGSAIPNAVPGADGDFGDDTTGSIAPEPAAMPAYKPDRMTPF